MFLFSERYQSIRSKSIFLISYCSISHAFEIACAVTLLLLKSIDLCFFNLGFLTFRTERNMRNNCNCLKEF